MVHGAGLLRQLGVDTVARSRSGWSGRCRRRTATASRSSTCSRTRSRRRRSSSSARRRTSRSTGGTAAGPSSRSTRRATPRTRRAPERGVNAIYRMAPIVAQIEDLNERLARRRLPRQGDRGALEDGGADAVAERRPRRLHDLPRPAAHDRRDRGVVAGRARGAAGGAGRATRPSSS